MVIVILGSAAGFCIAWMIYFFLIYRRERQKVEKRVDQWVQTVKKETSWSDSLSEQIDRSKWAEGMKAKLEKASLNLKPSEYGAFVFFAGVISVFLLSLGMDVSLIPSLGISIPLTMAGSRLFLKSRRNVYISKVDDQLSELCRLLGSTSRAGLSIPQGLELAVQEMPPPIQKELAIVVREVRLGKSLESSLQDLLARVNSRDMQVFVNALIIQRRAGGDIGKVMSEMARTMEERKIIHKTIAAVTSQARYSAYALPVVSIMVVLMISKMIGDFDKLFTSAFGLILLSLFVTMQVVGLFLVKKISDIKV